MAGGPQQPAGRFEVGPVQVYRRLFGGRSTRVALGVLGLLPTFFLLAVFCFGVLMLETLFAPAVVPIGLAAVTLPSLLLAWRGGARPAAHVAAIVLPAVLVPIVGLLGVDVLWASAHIGRPDPGLGLLLASIVVGHPWRITHCEDDLRKRPVPVGRTCAQQA